jgi:EAL domain-containing protein (putative c-di-GMP-specific phosphodiesterase class I)
MVGVEAVLRWEDPTRGSISPADFLPALEDTGLIVPVGRWRLREACAQSHAWSMQFPGRPPLQVTVTVSPREVSQSDFVEQLHQAISESGARPDTIVIEIDERTLLGDLGLLRQTLRAVRKLGVRVGLDDFGAGLGSIGHLRNFEIDVLKIDQSYVSSLADSPRDRAVVEHVIGLAKALDIVTLASGVDSASQVDRLGNLGCDLALGPYFATPQPAGVISELLATPAAAPEEPERQQVEAGALPHLRRV